MQISLDNNGWVGGVKHCVSPHCNARPDGSKIDLLVIHNISLPPTKYGSSDIEDFFQGKLDSSKDPYFETIKHLKVSAHFLIRRTGEIIQFVSVNDRAWHAGQSSFNGRENCNDFSIGIELEGTDFEEFTQAQYSALVEITHIIRHNFPDISLDRITGHSDIAPDRKTDPGPYFDWKKYKGMLSHAI